MIRQIYKWELYSPFLTRLQFLYGPYGPLLTPWGIIDPVVAPIWTLWADPVAAPIWILRAIIDPVVAPLWTLWAIIDPVVAPIWILRTIIDLEC